MQLSEVMYKRRSVRNFTPEAVSSEDIDTLLKYAMSGPSACNAMPWEFYVVKNDELIHKLRKVTSYTNYESPLIIIVAGNKKRALPGNACDFWIQDCSAAIENILLGAVDLGLGTCWCGLAPHITAVKRVQKALGLDEHMIPLGLIHVGRPAEAPEARTQYDMKRVHILD